MRCADGLRIAPTTKLVGHVGSPTTVHPTARPDRRPPGCRSCSGRSVGDVPLRCEARSNLANWPFRKAGSALQPPNRIRVKDPRFLGYAAGAVLIHGRFRFPGRVQISTALDCRRLTSRNSGRRLPHRRYLSPTNTPASTVQASTHS
jgi:hypothetical protein